MIDKIKECLMRYCPFSGQAGLLELKHMAVRFEEQCYTAATGQADYSQKLTLKLQTIFQSPTGHALQRDMQQRVQTSSPLLHHQNVVDPQKQLFQRQRRSPDGPSTSLDSTAGTGSVHGGDWQENAYQKISSMKEMYLAELNELYQRITSLLRRPDISRQLKNEHFELLDYLTVKLEKLFQLLRLNKNDIQMAHTEQISLLEKQIVKILNLRRDCKIGSSLPQGQLPQSRMRAMQQNQQSQPQITRIQAHENQMSSQMQASMDNQGSGLLMQQNSLAILNPLQQNANMIQHQQLKQEQQLLQSQQLIQLQQHRQLQKHYLQRREMLQQQKQRQLSIQRHKMLQQQQQQQTMQQQQLAQFSSHNMSQIHQINEVSEMMMRQQRMGDNSRILQHHHPAGQRAYYHPQLESGAPFISHQGTQLLSPQINQQNMPTPIPKAETPLQSSSSNSIGPSPSTPLSPSPIPDSSHGVGDGRPTSVEQAHERLMRVMKSMSSESLTASVRDIRSVVSMADRVAGPTPGNGSRAAVGEDLAATTKYHLQERNFPTQGPPGSKK